MKHHISLGHHEISMQLLDYMIDEAENAMEQIQDSAYWDMSLDDLRELRPQIKD